MSSDDNKPTMPILRHEAECYLKFWSAASGMRPGAEVPDFAIDAFMRGKVLEIREDGAGNVLYAAVYEHTEMDISEFVK